MDRRFGGFVLGLDRVETQMLTSCESQRVIASSASDSFQDQNSISKRISISRLVANPTTVELLGWDGAFSPHEKKQ